LNINFSPLSLYLKFKKKQVKIYEDGGPQIIFVVSDTIQQKCYEYTGEQGARNRPTSTMMMVGSHNSPSKKHVHENKKPQKK
jgi:hypothetical protein